jgi:uracil-DNA glycosylase
LKLQGAWLTAAVHCAPPDNKPTVAERETCRSFLEMELELLTEVTTIVCLGGFAYDNLFRILRDRGEDVPRPKPKFGHGVEVVVGERILVCSFHPSQQNTFTGRLTEDAFDRIWTRARHLVAATFNR